MIVRRASSSGTMDVDDLMKEVGGRGVTMLCVVGGCVCWCVHTRAHGKCGRAPLGCALAKRDRACPGERGRTREFVEAICRRGADKRVGWQHEGAHTRRGSTHNKCHKICILEERIPVVRRERFENARKFRLTTSDTARARTHRHFLASLWTQSWRGVW